jgi:hypothetical protein
MNFPICNIKVLKACYSIISLRYLLPLNRWSGGVQNRVDAPLDVSVGVVQRIRGGSGRIRRGCTTYPLGLCNVSGVVRNRVGGVLRWSVGVRNQVDASLDVSVGVVQRIRGGPEPGRRAVGRIRWGYATYLGWFRTGSEGF